MDGTVATLLSPRAFAPGSPIRLRVEQDGEERALEGRTIGSKRVHGERYEVRLRFVNLLLVGMQLNVVTDTSTERASCVVNDVEGGHGSSL